MSVSHQIALWADKLRDIAAAGLKFSPSHYDTQRYQAIQDTSIEMLAVATGKTVDHIEPLRETIFSRITPLVAGEGGVIDSDGRILLIRRADNRMWAMPGGALEVGETAAEGATREVLEETGVRVQPTALVGLFDSRRSRPGACHHLYHILFLCRPIGGIATATGCSHANETVDVGWFAEDALPDELSPGHDFRIPTLYSAWHHGAPAFFDKPL